MDGSPMNLSERLKKTDRKLVCYGAGTVARSLPDIFKEYGIWDNICFFVDGSNQKQGTAFILDGKSFDILSPEALRECANHIILITCEAFMPVIEYLDNMRLPDEIECYAYPLMNYRYFCENKSEILQPTSSAEKIPRIIHYCWFGGKNIPDDNRRCIESWKQFCPDYEVFAWNEWNFDVSKNEYVKRAYQAKKYAFVSDFARWDILHEIGGIYLDADVELTANIDDLLRYDAFCAFSEWPLPNSGSGCGAVKGLDIVREMKELPRHFDEWHIEINGEYEAKVLKKHGFKQDFSCQRVLDMLILPPDVFAPQSLLAEDLYITERTRAIHHCIGSWKTKGTLTDRNDTRNSYNTLLSRIALAE